MIDIESSNRLALLRFPLIVGVVFIHMYGSLVGFTHKVGAVEYGPVASFVQNIVSEGIARTAVPLFFLISGYFFFLNFQWSANGYFSRLKSRAKSLLVPFIFWNLLTLLMYAIAQSIPSIQGQLSGKGAKISEFAAFDFVNAVLGINRSPIAHQFWFIRDLIILVIISPLLHAAIKKLGTIFIAILAICWLAGLWPLYLPSAEAALFFSSGAFVAITGKSLFLLDGWKRLVYPLYIVLLIAEAIFWDMKWVPYLHRVEIASGVVAVLCLSKSVNKSNGARDTLLALSGASFFVFAAHEPIISVSRRIAYAVVHPSSDTAFLAIYFMLPLILITVLVLIYRGALLTMPKFIGVVTGGR